MSKPIKNCWLISQMDAKRKFDEIHKTNLWPEPCLRVYTKDNKEVLTSFCWVIFDRQTGAEMWLQAFKLAENPDATHDSGRFVRVAQEAIFYLQDKLFTLKHTKDDGYILRRIYGKCKLQPKYAALPH